MTSEERTERNLIPSGFIGGRYGCLYLPSCKDHLVIVSERLDNMRLAGVFSVCQHHGKEKMGWYYRHGNDVDEFNIEEWFEWNDGLGCPTGCQDLKSALVEAVVEYRKRGGL
jgi:TPR repeat protein